MALECVDVYFRDVDFVQVEKVLGAFFNSIAGMGHRTGTTVGTPDAAARQAIVTYTGLDGSEVPLPVCSSLHRCAPGKIDKRWIYIDTNPHYAAEAG